MILQHFDLLFSIDVILVLNLEVMHDVVRHLLLDRQLRKLGKYTGNRRVGQAEHVIISFNQVLYSRIVWELQVSYVYDILGIIAWLQYALQLPLVSVSWFSLLYHFQLLRLSFSLILLIEFLDLRMI